MRTPGAVGLAFLLLVVVASPAVAGVATIETTALLQDQADTSIQAALKQAIRTALKGALAMGLPWVRVDRALVLGNMVVVKISATDTDPEGGGEGELGSDGVDAWRRTWQ